MLNDYIKLILMLLYSHSALFNVVPFYFKFLNPKMERGTPRYSPLGHIISFVASFFGSSVKWNHKVCHIVLGFIFK